MMLALGRLLLLLAAGPEDDAAVLDALERRARETLAALRHPEDRASWEAAVPRLRARLRASLGVDRTPPGTAAARTVGVVERDGFRIVKLVFGGFGDVPAHLYLPAKVTGKLPAILFVPGHWWHDSKTREDFQAFCLNMARKGFAVLTYDPIGQGERGISLRDHRRTESLPWGVAQMGLAAREALTALAVLRARPEVDPARVGITGASGGGYTSWILPALDGGIAVSVPVVGTSEFYEQVNVVRERDWYDAKEHCHFVPGLFRYANNHELLALLAPRPVMIIAAHNDHGFRIPGNREIAGYGRRLYAALGAGGRVGYFEDETEGHGYQKRKREAAYGWFAKWLKGEGDGRPMAEPATETLPWDAPELRCFPPGENRAAGPAIVAAFSRWRSGATTAGRRPEEVRRTLVEMLGIGGELEALPSVPLSVSHPRGQRAPGPRIRRVSWRMPDGVEIPGLLLGEPPWTGAMVGAADAGKEALLGDPVVREALEAGRAVLLADVRGMGARRVSKPGWVFATSLLLGESFVGRQALDLLAGVRALSALPEVRGPVGLLGVGPFAALAALYAAVLEPRVASLTTAAGLSSFAALVHRPRSHPRSFALAAPGEERTVEIDREIPAALVPFDVHGKLDIPDLQRAVAPRPVRVLSTVDGDTLPP